MRVFPLIAGAAFAVSGCSDGTTDPDELAVENLTVQNLVVDDAAPVTNDVAAPSQPAAVEPPAATTARTDREAETPRTTPEASRPREAPPKTKPSPEPAPDPHAGHDMNDMNSM